MHLWNVYYASPMRQMEAQCFRQLNSNFTLLGYSSARSVALSFVCLFLYTIFLTTYFIVLTKILMIG